jgi:hypothetical protein
MARTHVLKTIRTRLFEGLFTHDNELKAETLEILADVEQLSQLLASMDDIRHHRVATLSEAFADI